MTSLKQTDFTALPLGCSRKLYRKPSVSGWTNPLVTWLTQLQKMFQTLQQKRWTWHCLYRQTDRTASPAPQHLTIVLFALWGHGSCGESFWQTHVGGWDWDGKEMEIYQFFPCLAKISTKNLFFVQSFVTYIEFRNNHAMRLCTLKFHFFFACLLSCFARPHAMKARKGHQTWGPGDAGTI